MFTEPLHIIIIAIVVHNIIIYQYIINIEIVLQVDWYQYDQEYTSIYYVHERRAELCSSRYTYILNIEYHILFWASQAQFNVPYHIKPDTLLCDFPKFVLLMIVFRWIMIHIKKNIYSIIVISSDVLKDLAFLRSNDLLICG